MKEYKNLIDYLSSFWNVLIFLILIFKNVKAEITPLWLNTTNDALDSGVDIYAVYRLHCGRVCSTFFIFLMN